MPSPRPTGAGPAQGTGGRGLASTSFAHLGYMTKLFQGLRGGGNSFIMGRWSARRAWPVALPRSPHRRDPHPGGLMLAHQTFGSTDFSRRSASSPWAAARPRRRSSGGPGPVRCPRGRPLLPRPRPGGDDDVDPQGRRGDGGRARARPPHHPRRRRPGPRPGETGGSVWPRPPWTVTTATPMPPPPSSPPSGAAPGPGDLGHLDDGAGSVAGPVQKTLVRGGGFFPWRSGRSWPTTRPWPIWPSPPAPIQVMGRSGWPWSRQSATAPTTRAWSRSGTPPGPAGQPTAKAILLTDELPGRGFAGEDRPPEPWPLMVATSEPERRVLPK